ncbi:hypothetical protein MesoLjLc_02860 [Mesorhizobium sp. L-8-10]|uniref:LapA family protein n=1 Tax=unclassified Mesorhizobium TaxID=325217 RepID=UPI001926B954|nr:MULTISPECIES: LapA family protein [unclassified Mesorhizobium]BCH20501.1 hypothetical protein MesoLjLb_02860 [Mesorhizobium sp. L-8-3]BCH28356.1 hypothetical protein MesoLjLc_02860 [Mesorhizobium sp. L-8-10]
MLNRFILIVVFVPLAIILIALAVANRGLVAFTLDPFNPGNPALTVQLPLFVLLFAAVLAGLLIGSSVTWWRQGRYRKLARRRDQELQSLRAVAPAGQQSTAVSRTAA